MIAPARARRRHVHVLLEPPCMRSGPAGMRQRWDDLPCGAADARRGMGAFVQLLALRGCQRAVLTNATAAAAPAPAPAAAAAAAPAAAPALSLPSLPQDAVLASAAGERILSRGRSLLLRAVEVAHLCGSGDTPCADSRHRARGLRVRALCCYPTGAFTERATGVTGAALPAWRLRRPFEVQGPTLPLLPIPCAGDKALRHGHIEYFGALRTISRLETERAESKRVRRFVHYLDKFDMRKDDWKLVNPMMAN
tara:strand:+ start:181 stop:936 length:756 start_codon:yes stop_codon:yes gene_type:complete